MSKHWKYFKYVLWHKWFVFVAGRRLGVPLWLLVIHDWSKFRPSEWFAYAQHFYGDNSAEFWDAKDKYMVAEAAPYGFFARDRFNLAWLHHQHRNKHHWQYWVQWQCLAPGPKVMFPMPEKYMREMVADWVGAGRAQGTGSVREWFCVNVNRMVLRDKERVQEIVESYGVGE